MIDVLKSPYDFTVPELGKLLKKVMIKENDYLFQPVNLMLRLGIIQYDSLDGIRLSETMQYMKRKGWCRYRSIYRKWENRLYRFKKDVYYD